MATVNGQPIYMDRLHELLLRAGGMEVAQQLILNELVRQEAENQAVTATAQDVAEQTARTLETLFPEVTEPDQRDRLLEQLLVSKKTSRELWDLSMRRNALLRKLAAGYVQVTDEQIRAEFDERRTRKVQVRHIQAASAAEAQDVLRQLAAGEDFATLAQKVSKNPSARDGGLLPPLGPDTPLAPPAIRKAALAMKEVGQVTGPVQVGTSFHVLKLVRIIPPQNVQLEDVRSEIIETIRRRQLDLAAQNTLRRLWDRAVEGEQIMFVDPILKSQAQEDIFE